MMREPPLPLGAFGAFHLVIVSPRHTATMSKPLGSPGSPGVFRPVMLNLGVSVAGPCKLVIFGRLDQCLYPFPLVL